MFQVLKPKERESFSDDNEQWSERFVQILTALRCPYPFSKDINEKDRCDVVNWLICEAVSVRYAEDGNFGCFLECFFSADRSLCAEDFFNQESNKIINERAALRALQDAKECMATRDLFSLRICLEWLGCLQMIRRSSSKALRGCETSWA